MLVPIIMLTIYYGRETVHLLCDGKAADNDGFTIIVSNIIVSNINR